MKLEASQRWWESTGFIALEGDEDMILEGDMEYIPGGK
jgi:hypothetical protein